MPRFSLKIISHHSHPWRLQASTQPKLASPTPRMHHIATHVARNPHDLYTTILQPTHAAHLQSACTPWPSWPPHAHPCDPQSFHGHPTTTMQPAHPHMPNHVAHTSLTTSMQPMAIPLPPCSSLTPPSQLKAILTCTHRLPQHHHETSTSHSSPTTSIWPPQSPHNSPTQSSHIPQLTTHLTIWSHVAQGLQMATNVAHM